MLPAAAAAAAAAAASCSLTAAAAPAAAAVAGRRLLTGLLGGGRPPSSAWPQQQQQHHQQQLRAHGGHAASAAAADEQHQGPAKRAVASAKKHLKDFAKLPWELDMPHEAAATLLAGRLGLPAGSIQPGAVLDLDADQITGILEATTNGGDTQLNKALFSHADAVTQRFFGEKVYYRGIVEFSNVCQNDCGYCGIAKHTKGVSRYTMPADEVVEVAKWTWQHGMGTLMLQAGELPTPQRLAYLEEVTRRIVAETTAMDLEARGLDPQAPPPPGLGEVGLRVALSVGELPRDEYQRLYDAGARRYLLRIETSNPDLYAALHPPAMSWDRRMEALRDLKEIGFMVGTGVMVGLPGQTLRDLANDIRLFADLPANMIGMGPYITEAGTPVADMWDALFSHVDKPAHMRAMFELTTRMNALARIVVGSANISATTALQAIEPNGREVALRRGCNVLMPILTPTKYREHYQLYEGKPCITDTAEECRSCLNARVGMIGKKLQAGAWGDPLNFLAPVTSLDVRALQAAAAAGGGGGAGAGGGVGASTAAPAGLPTQQRRGLHTSAAAHRSAAQPHPSTTSSPAPLPPSTERGSDVPRINVGVFGAMNAGKSTLMNAITRQQTSIVDATPGTTADVRVSLMELHDLGPVKLFDTAGIDEPGELGAKKRQKSLSALKESDVGVVVVDAARHVDTPREALADALHWESLLLQTAARYQVTPLILVNLKGLAAGSSSSSLADAILAVLDPERRALSLVLDLHHHADATAGSSGSPQDVPSRVAAFLQDGVSRSRARPSTRSLPEWALAPDAAVFLNIPMDAETPSMRLLRPQALVQEEAIRYWATTTAYRMDLAAARSGDPAAVAGERARFDRALAPLLAHEGPKLLVTDSQAMDVVHPWTLDEAGAPLLPITTFSIAMIHRQSGGRLPLFVEGIKALQGGLAPGDAVLVAEACNHNRITDHCNDIGMVQIPAALERLCGAGLKLEHAFGREYPEMADDVSPSSSSPSSSPPSAPATPRFKLALHCGGCMIDPQKMRARLQDMEDAGVPVTNYGLFLSYVQSPQALARVLQPWGVAV